MNHFSPLIATLALVVGLGACAQSPFGTADAPTGSDPSTPIVERYRLSGGDVVRIDVFGEPDLSLDATLEPDGSINYPLLGRLSASGLTSSGLEKQLVERLKAGYLHNPQVRVRVVQFQPIYIIGQVRKSGAYPYSPGLTVEQALALAGGMTALASTRRIFVQPKGGDELTRQRSGLDTALRPGDTLIVEEGLF